MQPLYLEGRSRPRVARASWAIAGCLTLAAGSGRAQESKDYILSDGQRLMIVVHALGEVKRPGEYTVDDNTTVMELVSKAGGSTEFAALDAVLLTRQPQPRPFAVAGLGVGQALDAGSGDSTEVLRVDLKAYLEGKSPGPPPTLRPGDIVTVPTNSYFKWRRVAGIARDLSVVASAYFLYLRAANNN